jgi:hypothetical protein
MVRAEPVGNTSRFACYNANGSDWHYMGPGPKSVSYVVRFTIFTFLSSVVVFAQSQQSSWGTQQPESSRPPLTPQQLDTLVAPIALYPDAILSQVLAATTYPLELVEAWQWSQQRSELGARN